MKTILVVDDERNLRLLYEKELKDEGYQVALASDAKDATAVKWGFVVGTLFGAGYGFYAVTSRPQPSALIELREGRPASGGLAAVQGGPGGTRVRVLAVRF